MDESDGADSKRRGRRSKVVSLIDHDELKALGGELEQLWTADDDRHSLRDLAECFNQQLLAHTLEDAAVQTFDGEIENMYRLLTDDDVSSAESTRIKRRLERDGVDVETLSSDFVTYKAIGTYLKFLGEFRTLADIKVVF
jgi:hypothetical protein